MDLGKNLHASILWRDTRVQLMGADYTKAYKGEFTGFGVLLRVGLIGRHLYTSCIGVMEDFI